MPKISIIIPVYNTEKYLKQCLDSIINQTFKDFECICINDGSTDNSLTILHEYSKKDNRIKIINQKNSGSSVSRNNGIKQALGQYVSFIDADDWITNNYLEILYNKIIETDADIVRASFKFYYQKDDICESAKIREIHKIKNNTDIERLYKGYAGAFVWAKLYKKSLIKDNNIYFYEVKTAEDCPFSALVYLYAKKICFINDEIYFYRKQIEGVTANYQGQIIDAFDNFIELSKDLINRNFVTKEILNFLTDTFFYKVSKLSNDNISFDNKKSFLKKSIEHFNYLQTISKKCGFFDKFKIKLSLILLNKFNIKAFKLFRILKNL